MVGLSQTLAVKNIVYLTNGHHIISRVLKGVEGSPSIWLQRIIMAVGGAPELALLHAGIGPGNDASHLPFIPQGQFPGNLAVVIQVVKSHGLLVAAYLKHGISGSIYDQMAFPNLLLRQFIQDFRSAGALVADDFTSGPLLQLVYQFLRKTVAGKCLEGRGHKKPHHLPVSRHGVLATASLLQTHVTSQGVFCRLHTL